MKRGGSNEYPHPMFFSRNKKNNVYPCKPQFYYVRVFFFFFFFLHGALHVINNLANFYHDLKAPYTIKIDIFLSKKGLISGYMVVIRS